MLNISIVLYKNREEQIKLLINDILLNDITLINKLYLVDNSPTTKLSLLAKMSNKIEYIHCHKNLGYGVAHNIAIKASLEKKIKYHLVLNPDIRLTSNVLAKLVIYMDNNTDVGLVMPNVCYPDGKQQHLCKLLPTPLSLFSRRFLPKMISSKFDRKYNILNINYAEETNVPILSGCFMFMRTNALAEVGIFDPRFFMYLEDFDLIRRIHAKYRTMFYPSVQIIHEYTKGSYKKRKLMVYHVTSAIKYFNKHGWIFDQERRHINVTFLKRYKNS